MMIDLGECDNPYTFFSSCVQAAERGEEIAVHIVSAPGQILAIELLKCGVKVKQLYRTPSGVKAYIHDVEGRLCLSPS